MNEREFRQKMSEWSQRIKNEEKDLAYEHFTRGLLSHEEILRLYEKNVLNPLVSDTERLIREIGELPASMGTWSAQPPNPAEVKDAFSTLFAAMVASGTPGLRTEKPKPKVKFSMERPVRKFREED